MKKRVLFSPVLLAAAMCETSLAHPEPDIPVRSTFNKDGTVAICVEVDPRCFAEDALNEPYLQNAILQSYTKNQKADLFLQTSKLIAESIEFRMNPKGRVLPKFEMRFTTFSNQPLIWNTDNPRKNRIKTGRTPVVVTAKWTTRASQFSGYQIKALTAGKFSVQFINMIGKQEQPLNVLFPGEESYVLDLKAWAKSTEKDSSEAEKPKK